MENRGCLREIPTTWLCHMIYMIELFQSKDGLSQEKTIICISDQVAQIIATVKFVCPESLIRLSRCAGCRLILPLFFTYGPHREKNLSLGFPTKQVSNLSLKLHRIAK